MRKTAFISIIALLALAWSASAGTPAALRRFAFVAGCNDGGDGLTRLKYAESDARSFASVMQDLGGVRPQDLVLVENPNLQRFQDGLGRVRQLIRSPREMDERRELVIYYSGHSDDAGLILGRDRVAWEDLRKDMADIPADIKVAILDSCSSGSLTRAKGGVARQAFLFDASSDMTGHAYLTSASAEEAAQESDRIGGSFFTHFLVSGLRGAADTVGDGQVTLEEAYAYAYQETLASTMNTEYGPQHPARELELEGSGKIVLTDLRSSEAGLTVADDVVGRMYLRDIQGALAVELNKPYGQKVELGLEPGTYTVMLDNKGTRTTGEVRVTAKQRAVVTLASLHPMAVDPATARGAGPEAPPPRAPVVAATDPAAAIGAVVGAAVGSALGKAAGAAVNAAITAAAAVAGAASANASPSAAPDDAGSAGPSAAAAPASSAGPLRPQVLHFSLLPDLSAGPFSSTEDHVVSLNVLVGTSSTTRAFEVAGIANFESHDVMGFQAAGLVNVAKGDLKGFQSAGLLNFIGGDARFVQSAGLLNVAGSLTGAQLAGLGNVSVGQTSGAQVSGGFNWAAQEVRGAQVAGGFNWAGAGISGAQVSGGFNWGKTVTGPQIGVLNVADTVSGAQIGVVNIARHVSGTQIGVLNISEKIDGIPIGVLSIEGQGRHDLDLWVDLDGSTAAAFSFGTKRLYSVASVGWTPGPNPALWSVGLGLGGRSDVGPLFLDYDLSLVAEHQGFAQFDSPMGSLYPRLRVVLGLPLFGGFAVDAGMVLRVLIPYLSDSIDGADPSKTKTVFQPGLIVGVHI